MANITNQNSGFCKKIKHCIQNFNLFSSVPPATDKNELYVQRISTFIFLIGLIVLLIIPFVYFPFISNTGTVGTTIIESPSLNHYLQLYSKYPQTLKCTCSQAAISYQKFISIDFKYHEVCNSIFVTDEWISHLDMNTRETLYSDDFRITGSHAFQGLRMLCELIPDIVSDSSSRFFSTHYISASVIPLVQFHQQIQSIMDQFRLSTTNNFLLSLKMIQGTTQTNALFSGLQTNYRIDGNQNDNPLHVSSKKYNGCNCDLSAKCIQQSSIYDYLSTTKLFDIPGFYTGCNVIESLLQSTLQCFYDQICIDTLQTYLLSSSIHVPALKLSANLYPKNTTIQTLLEQLMIEEWLSETSYANYYAQCAPTHCSYIFQTTGIYHNALYTAIIIFFIVGGPLPVLKLIISLIAKLIVCCIRKSNTHVFPETIMVYN